MKSLFVPNIDSSRQSLAWLARKNGETSVFVILAMPKKRQSVRNNNYSEILGLIDNPQDTSCFHNKMVVIAHQTCKHGSTSYSAYKPARTMSAVIYDLHH